MNAKEYQKIYQNIKEKAPIESGVQTLVYMFLYEIIKDTDFQLIVVDRMGKKTQFITATGISDLAIVSDEFRYNEKHKNKILTYVEVKSVGINLHDFEEQIKGQLLSCGRVLCTNGSVWKYYDVNKYIESNSENIITEIWGDNQYKEIKQKIEELESVEITLAKKKLSYAHTPRENEFKKKLEKDICNLEKEKSQIYDKFEKLHRDILWLEDMMYKPIINIELYDNDVFDINKYMNLKAKLYDVISTW